MTNTTIIGTFLFTIIVCVIIQISLVVKTEEKIPNNDYLDSFLPSDFQSEEIPDTYTCKYCGSINSRKENCQNCGQTFKFAAGEL
jgi:hypothetical protein